MTSVTGRSQRSRSTQVWAKISVVDAVALQMTDRRHARRMPAARFDRVSPSRLTDHACDLLSDEAVDLGLRLARALSIGELRVLVERVEAGGGVMPLAALLSPEELRTLVALMAARRRPRGAGTALDALPARGAA